MQPVPCRLPFHQRSQLAVNPSAKRLLQIIADKQSNLVFNADVDSGYELLKFADMVGPYIAVLKTHIDIIQDFSPRLINSLLNLSEKHNFLLFEDRKFADIGATAKKQYKDGIYKIASWADITNAHVISGPGMIEGLQEVGYPLGRGLLLVAEMSSKGSLTVSRLKETALEMAALYPEFVIGFVCQTKLTEDPRLIHFTPGVSLSSNSDSLGQQYKTPEAAIKECQSDLIIVGRGIARAQDPQKEAEKYRQAAWEAYHDANKAVAV